MALDHNEFVQLSRIEEALRRSDPELASKLAAPMRRRPLPVTIAYIALAVMALLAVCGWGISEDTSPSRFVAQASRTHQDHRLTAATFPRCGPQGAQSATSPTGRASPDLAGGRCPASITQPGSSGLVPQQHAAAGPATGVGCSPTTATTRNHGAFAVPGASARDR
jgi:Protein of unknown function (DUF3040)